jgi:hypothetical protein
MKMKGKHPKGRPRSRWKQMAGIMSCKREEENGRILGRSFRKARDR